MEFWIKLIWYGSVFSPAIPLLSLTKRDLLPYQVILVFFIIISFASDLIATFFVKGNNYWFLTAYGFVETVILLMFYKSLLPNYKRMIFIVGILYSLIYIANAFFLERWTFNGTMRAIECLLMIMFSLILFYQFYQTEEDIFIDGNPKFWFNVAILVYFSGAFFSFILSKEVLMTGIEAWLIHNVSNIIKNCILTVGLWKGRK